MVKTVLSHHGVFSHVPCRYLIMGYESGLQEETGAVQTAFGATFSAPALSRVYGMKRTEGGKENYWWNLEEIERTLFPCLSGRSSSRIPLRIVGFPAYIYFLAKELERRKNRLALPASSCILMSGGWKTFWREEIGREEFNRLAEQVLGIPKNRFLSFTAPWNIIFVPEMSGGPFPRAGVQPGVCPAAGYSGTGPGWRGGHLKLCYSHDNGNAPFKHHDGRSGGHGPAGDGDGLSLRLQNSLF